MVKGNLNYSRFIITLIPEVFRGGTFYKSTFDMMDQIEICVGRGQAGQDSGGENDGGRRKNNVLYRSVNDGCSWKCMSIDIFLSLSITYFILDIKPWQKSMNISLN